MSIKSGEHSAFPWMDLLCAFLDLPFRFGHAFSPCLFCSFDTMQVSWRARHGRPARRSILHQRLVLCDTLKVILVRSNCCFAARSGLSRSNSCIGLSATADVDVDGDMAVDSEKSPCTDAEGRGRSLQLARP